MSDQASDKVKQATAMLALLEGVFGGGSKQKSDHPFIGKYVLCRCYSAGVHCGTLDAIEGDQVILLNARRLWSWTANSGVALSGVAMTGLKPGSSKVDTVVPEIALTGVIEVIPCSPSATTSIHEYA